jgi:polyisoprenoid-binding protein YceI
MATVASPTQIPTGTWTSDPAHSEIGFEVKHMLITTIRGRFGNVSSTLISSEEGARIAGVAQLDSITTFDEQRDTHLHSPDFFDTERYAESNFEGTFVAPDRVEGNLTIKGVTKPVTFEAATSEALEDPWGNTRVTVDLSTTVDRREFGVEWNAPLPGGGLLVDNNVRLVASISYVRQSGSDE